MLDRVSNHNFIMKDVSITITVKLGEYQQYFDFQCNPDLQTRLDTCNVRLIQAYPRKAVGTR